MLSASELETELNLRRAGLRPAARTSFAAISTDSGVSHVRRPGCKPIPVVRRETEDERRLLQLTVALWNGFVELPDLHPSDRAEMCRDVHNIQHRLMARAVRRGDPNYFR
jgi:hypothetical protein